MAARKLDPASEEEVRDCIADAAREGRRLLIQAGGSKSAIGAPTEAVDRLDLRKLNGIIDYDHAELVLTVRPATPLTLVEAALAERNQMLAFEPFDHGALLGQETGRATIGGVVAAGVAGSQRLAYGGVRDHLLGFRAVSGRGEIFVGGAKVVKNVTGYDLPKLMAGSWGRLAALTELTLKVLPRPAETATRMIRGLSAGDAVAAMARAAGSAAELAAAAHMPAEVTGHDAITFFRLQGFQSSVAARCGMLERQLAEHGRVEPVDPEQAGEMWGGLRSLAPLGAGTIWRLVVQPSRAPAITAELEAAGAKWLLDWAGGLIWTSCDAPAEIIRGAASAAGGHAMMVRAEGARRKAVAALHPLPPPMAALEQRIRRAFDPEGLFEVGRF